MGGGGGVEEKFGVWCETVRTAFMWLEVVEVKFFHSRRRSFHDLSSLRDMRVLTPERMRIDVELCGQMLIMTRREQHLLNVLACLQVRNISVVSSQTLKVSVH